MPPYATGASHYLTSTGHVTIDEPTGLVIALTSLPAWLGSVVSDPIDYHQLGRYALGNADGFLPSQPLEHANTLLWPVSSGLTLVGLTLAPGVVATVTELTGGLFDAAAYAAAIVDLVAMTADRDAKVASLATRTTERDTARNSLYVSGTYLSGQTWQTKDGVSQTDLTTMTTDRNTKQSERDTARNSLYVSGTYLSGHTWQTKDATDLASYTALSAAIAELHYTITGASSATVGKTGRYLVSTRVAANASTSHAYAIQAPGATTLYTITMPAPGDSGGSVDLGNWGVANLTAGQAVTVVGGGGATTAFTTTVQFVPTTANP